ncbi:HEAT repeat domain-containing protein [Streptomyces sp. L7]
MQAGHQDAEDRAEAAFGLATAVTGREDDPAVSALIRLTGDAEPDVRDQATFALGTLAPVDGPDVRDALWARLDDTDPDTREEAVRGLALRRDPRAVPLLGELLAAGNAHPRTLQAAAVLADAAPLSVLEQYEPGDPGVAEALAACDPGQRDQRDRAAATLLEEAHRLLPGTDAALSLHRMEASPRPDAHRRGRPADLERGPPARTRRRRPAAGRRPGRPGHRSRRPGPRVGRQPRGPDLCARSYLLLRFWALRVCSFTFWLYFTFCLAALRIDWSQGLPSFSAFSASSSAAVNCFALLFCCPPLLCAT